MKYIHDQATGHSSRVPPAQRPKYPPHDDRRDIYADPTFADIRRVGALADHINVPAIRWDPILEELEQLGGPDVLHHIEQEDAA